MKEYIDMKGKGTNVQYPHNRNVVDSPEWVEDRQIPEDAVIMAGGFWWVVLPNDKHPEAMFLPFDNQEPPRWVHRSKCLEVEHAQKIIKQVNEFYRTRGGRPPRKAPEATPGPSESGEDFTLPKKQEKLVDMPEPAKKLAKKPRKKGKK